MLRVGDDMEVVKQKSYADPLTSYVRTVRTVLPTNRYRTGDLLIARVHIFKYF
jgi:hypothetical protein